MLQAYNMKYSGFTIVELVVVLIITGVLAAVAVPRFFVSQQFYDRGFYNQALAISRYAQKSAIAMRRNVCVNIASATLSINLTYASAVGSSSTCDTNLPSPVAGTAPFTVTAKTGTTLSSSSTPIIFNALGGVSSAAATTTITVSSRTITIDTNTGYVR